MKAAVGTPLRSLGLSVRSYNNLRRAGYATVESVSALSDTDILLVRNLGEGSLKEIRTKIKELPPELHNRKVDAQEEMINFEIPAPWALEAQVEHLPLNRGTRDALLMGGIPTLDDLLDCISQRRLGMIKQIGSLRRDEVHSLIAELWRRHPVRPEDLKSYAAPINSLFLSSEAETAIKREHISSVSDLARILQPESPSIGAMQDEILAEMSAKLVAHLASVGIRKPSEEGEDSTDLVGDVRAMVARDPESVEELINDWLQTLSERNQIVIKKRFGIAGSRETLDEIGEVLGVTRERIRQIERKALKRLAFRSTYVVVSRVKALGNDVLEISGGVLPEKLAGKRFQEFMELGDVRAEGALKLILELNDEVSWLPRTRTWVRDDLVDTVIAIQRLLVQLLKDEYAPVSALKFLEKFEELWLEQTDSHPPSEQLIMSCVMTDPLLLIDEQGRVGLEKWTRHRLDEMVLALREIGEPAHYKAIAEKTNLLLPPEQRTTAKNIHAHISRLPEVFVRVGHGVFGLAEWGLSDDGNLANAAARVLREAGKNLHIEEITDRVLETWKARPGSVEAAMVQDARFVDLGSGYYILREQLDSEKAPSSPPIAKRKREPSIGSDILIEILGEIEKRDSESDVSSEEGAIAAGSIRLFRHEGIIEQNGARIPIMDRAARLLEFLIERKNKPVLKQELLEVIGRRGYGEDLSVVDAHIQYLREAVEKDPLKPKLIVSVGKESYKLSVSRDR